MAYLRRLEESDQSIPLVTISRSSQHRPTGNILVTQDASPEAIRFGLADEAAKYPESIKSKKITALLEFLEQQGLFGVPVSGGTGHQGSVTIQPEGENPVIGTGPVVEDTGVRAGTQQLRPNLGANEPAAGGVSGLGERLRNLFNRVFGQASQEVFARVSEGWESRRSTVKVEEGPYTLSVTATISAPSIVVRIEKRGRDGEPTTFTNQERAALPRLSVAHPTQPRATQEKSFQRSVFDGPDTMTVYFDLASELGLSAWDMEFVDVIGHPLRTVVTMSEGLPAPQLTEAATFLQRVEGPLQRLARAADVVSTQQNQATVHELHGAAIEVGQIGRAHV